MPELPEVETVARGLAKLVTGDVIESIWLGGKKEPLKSPAKVIARALENARVHRVRRVGKQIVFDLLDPAGGRSQWVVHLGMTGQMLVCPPDRELKKHTHAIAKLASGRELRFVDPRRFGRLSIARNGDFTGTGLEPLEVDRETSRGSSPVPLKSPSLAMLRRPNRRGSMKRNSRPEANFAMA